MQENVPIYGRWVGTTEGFVNAKIRPKVEGYLREQIYLNGASVKKGAIMFQIDPRQFQAQVESAQGDLGRAKAALGRSQQDVLRYTPLAKQGAVSQKELDDAVQAELANKASVESAQAAVYQAELNLGWTKITSPIDGVAGIAVAQIGDLVGPSTVLTTVSTIDPMKVEFPISEQQYLEYRRSQIRSGRTGDGKAQLTLADGSVYKEPGRFYALGREVNPETGTIMVETTFPNPKGLLRPGQYAMVRVQIDERKNATVVPQRALKDLQGQYQVAVVGKDDVIDMRNVEVGPTYGSLWVIEKGLAPGETIVVEGLQSIRSGVKVIAKPAPTATPATSPGTASATPAGG
jgi:membrane fusion protein (multidrug efflux system)